MVSSFSMTVSVRLSIRCGCRDLAMREMCRTNSWWSTVVRYSMLVIRITVSSDATVTLRGTQRYYNF